jgi:hypothetical protein
MSSAAPPKPWPVSVFETQRPHLTNFVRNEILPLLEDRDNRRIIVRAPVKCGKREMVEYIAMRDSVEKPTRVHAFLSAWHRTADADQRDELKDQNMEVFSITTQKRVDAFLKWLFNKRLQKKTIVLHLDECDHGSGSKQMLSKVWKVTRDVACITNILYSATPEEVLYSGEVEDAELHEMMEGFVAEGHHVEYTPPEGYCGPKRFLDEGLVHEALPFFHKEGDTFVLSTQGKEIVADLRASMAVTPKRNLVVLRLSYSELGGKQADIKKNKAIYQFLNNIGSFPELADFIVVVDKGDDMGIKCDQISTEKIQWSSRTYWKRQTAESPILLVIDQTSSRSTEWACHDRIFATHDYRNVVQYSTISQAQERVNHYEQRYGGFQAIRVYGHTRTFLLSAGKIDYDVFLTNPWEKKKIDVRTSPVPMYRVRSSATGHALHPECPETGLLEVEADRLLQRLGCFADISLSARVAGSVKQTPTTTCAFLECDKDNWDTVWPAYRSNPANGFGPAESTRVHNPFEASKVKGLEGDKYKGHLRTWKVLDYDTEVSESLWGMGEGGAAVRLQVCYKDGKLGVAIKRRTGWETKNTLRAYNSMYKGRV